MNNNSRIPKIRFKGFANDWEQRELGELGKVYTGNTPSTFDSVNWTNDKEGHVWITPTDINCLLTNSSERHLSEIGWSRARVIPENSVLITSIASIGKNTINTVPAAFNQQINAIVPENNDAYFLLSTMISREANFASLAGQTATAIINKTTFKRFNLMIPIYEEQTKIGEFFKQLDHLITLHQRKLKKIDNIKKSLLIKLFPKGTNSVPEVRVSRFNSEWKKIQLKDVVTEIKRNDPNYDAPIMMISSRNGFIKQSDRYSYDNSGNSKNKYTLIFKGELSYNHGASKLRPFGSTFALKEEAAHVPFVYHSFDVNGNDPYFMETVLNSKYVENQLRKIISSGARMDGLLNISFKEYSSIEVLLPSPEEQRVISAYLKEFDNLIDTTEKKLKKIKNIKESLLEKMIV